MSPPPPPGRRRFRRPLVLALAALPALLLGWYFWGMYGAGNLHAVIPGQVYRGGQHSPAALEALIHRLGIRTVVNLRGCCDPHPWYLEQARLVQRLGLSQEDVSFSAIHLPSTHELRQLVEVIDRAEYPIFFHCRHGADRTGLAAAVTLLLKGEVSYEEARGQLGLRYGHVFVGKTTVLDRFFDLYEDWLAETYQEHAGEYFRQWVLHEYQGGWCNGRVEAMVPLEEEAKVGLPIGYRVTVRNLGKTTWQFKPTATAGMHLFFQVWDEEGRGAAVGRAGMKEATVGPGESIDLTLVIPPLARAGRYRLLVDMIEEYHCWFFQVGAEPWEEELDVRE
jgi:protein tyrosine phosphatase (PTP) superfamily phosphohydrolase (DUF442 family)